MMKVTRAPEGFEAEFEQMKYQAELAKNPQPAFPFPAAGGRLGPLPGGFGQMGGGGQMRPGMRPGMGRPGRPGMGGRPRRPGAPMGGGPPGARPGAPMGGSPGGMRRPVGGGAPRRPMMRQAPGTQQQFGDGPPHLSASYQQNFQKDIDATQYSQAAIKAMQNYKKRQSVDAIDAPMPSIPQRPVRPQAPPIQAPVAPPMMQQPGMDPQMEELLAMMELLAQQEQQQQNPAAGMQIINGIPVMPDPTPPPAPVEHSYPAKVEPVDPLRDVSPIKPLQVTFFVLELTFAL